MADDSDSDHRAPPASSDHQLQPFFVLHKASAAEATELEPRPRTARRKIHVSPSSDTPRGEPTADEHNDLHYEELRQDAFRRTWSKVEEEIKSAFRRIDRNVFSEVHRWVLDRFAGIDSARTDCLHEISQSYPVMHDEICKRIPTGLMLTRNAEFVDNLFTFRELGAYLKSKGCHVACFSSIDFESKQGAGDCLRSLVRQVVAVAPDRPDVSVLASWYCSTKNSGKPVVIIVDDTEQCNGSALGEFITVLSEWVIKIPAILILGIATSIDAPKKLLSSNVLLHLKPYKFTLDSSHERLNSVIQVVLVRRCFGFFIGHKVAYYLRNYFLKHDGTSTAFIRALKIACSKHFCLEPLSFLGCSMLDHDVKLSLEKACESLPGYLIDAAFDLPSSSGESVSGDSASVVFCRLHELWKLQKCWSSVLLCLFDIGRVVKLPLLDLFCDALNPESYMQRAVAPVFQHVSESMSSKLHCEMNFGFGVGSILHALSKLRDLPLHSLINIVKLWKGHCKEMPEVYEKVDELHIMLCNASKEAILKTGNDNVPKSMLRPSPFMNTSITEANHRAATLMGSIVKDYLKPVESFPFHEIICFKRVDLLQEALIGDPRRTLQTDLRKPHTYMHCSSKGNKKSAVSSMHDTTVIYSLAQEFGDLVNLHDWYQSFKDSILSLHKIARHGVQSPTSKKRVAVAAHLDTTEAVLQARFCLAVKELLLIGLIRMPSKRRPDYVQRVAFGI